MDYCGPRGIPYGDFMDDRIWSPLSRDAALAWHLREARRCGSCGQVKEDWMAHDADGNPIIGPNGKPAELNPEPFDVVHHHCPACDRLARRRNTGEKLNDGVTYAFVPATPPPTTP